MKLKSLVMLFLVGGSFVFSPAFLQAEITSFKEEFQEKNQKAGVTVDLNEIVFWLYILSALGIGMWYLLWIIENLKNTFQNKYVLNANNTFKSSS